MQLIGLRLVPINIKFLVAAGNVSSKLNFLLIKFEKYVPSYFVDEFDLRLLDFKSSETKIGRVQNPNGSPGLGNNRLCTSNDYAFELGEYE